MDNFIQQVGVYPDGSMAVPENINVAGWFELRAKPGQPGLSIINGHLAGREYAGIFAGLDRLAAGDRFQIEMGDRSMLTFEITHNFKASTAEAAEYLYQTHHPNQLNLVTCIGDFQYDQQTYDHRQIVVSKLVSP